MVLARNPDWDRSIIVSSFQQMDVLLISLSNGGLISLNSTVLEVKSEEGMDFDVAIQNVTLASSLRVSVSSVTIQNVNVNASSAVDNKGKKLSNEKSSGVLTAPSKKPSKMSEFIHNCLSLTANRTTLLPLILSVMVVFVGVTSLPYASLDVSLFVLFSIMNSLYVMIMLYNYNINTSVNSKHGTEYILRLHGHSFTSPDAPVNSPDEDIPQRFIDGCDGDLKEARRRWDITRHWREAEALDNILNVPQPNYFIVKAMHPHYHFGRDRTGHVVYYERPAQGKFDELKARGVGVDDMYLHWLFFTEYQYNVLMGGGCYDIMSFLCVHVYGGTYLTFSCFFVDFLCV